MPDRPSSEHVLVAVGTSGFPFDRLVGATAALAAHGFDVLVQRGASSAVPDGVRSVDYLDRHAFDALMEDADVVVGHAGIGVTGAALRSGKPLVVVPRLAEHGEAVDDHQVAFARLLQRRGLAVCLGDPSQLVTAVVNARAAAVGRGSRDAFVRALRTAVSGAVSPASRRAPVPRRVAQ